MPQLVIAIDGPSGSGKSSVSQRVAAKLGLRYLDSGALYRAMTLALLDQGVPAEEGSALASALASINLSITDLAGPAQVRLSGKDVSEAIRGLAVTSKVSYYAALPSVRTAVGTIARGIIDGEGIVIEGRDIASVVAPEAQVKIFLTASSDVRAQRRQSEMVDEAADSVAESVFARDALDSTRAASPLLQVPDAHVIDSTNLGIEEVAELIVAIAKDVLAS